jgi:hypothetical protein
MKEKVILLVEDNPDDVELTIRAFKKNNILNKVIVVWKPWITYSVRVSMPDGM